MNFEYNSIKRFQVDQLFIASTELYIEYMKSRREENVIAPSSKQD